MLAVTEVKVETIVVGNSSSGKVPNALILCVFKCFLFPAVSVLSLCGKMVDQVVSSIAIAN